MNFLIKKITPLKLMGKDYNLILRVKELLKGRKKLFLKDPWEEATEEGNIENH